MGAVMAKCTRVMRFKARLDEVMKVEEAIERISPRIRALDGCDGFMFLVDRLTGRSMAVSLWDSNEAMQSSENAAGYLRKELLEQTGEEVLSIERYEIAPGSQLAKQSQRVLPVP
jgi:quinol monooxygenase YgiN